MNLKEIQKAVDEGKQDIIANMTDDELMQYIMALTNRYYISYLNNDRMEHKSILKTLDLITDEYKSNGLFNGRDDGGIDNFINYCMILNINSLLNSLMDRNFNLRVPEAVAINTDDDMMAANKEREKDIHNFILRRLKHTDNVRNMIRPDVTMDDVTNGMESLERIFLPEIITALQEVMRNE